MPRGRVRLPGALIGLANLPHPLEDTSRQQGRLSQPRLGDPGADISCTQENIATPVIGVG